MKKILFLLLSTIAMYGQIPADATQLENIQLTNNTQDVSAQRVIVQDADGVLRWDFQSNIKTPTKEFLSTGLLKNGLISINSDPTKFNVSAGIGIISNFDNPEAPTSIIVNFPAFTAVTPTYLTTGNITYIAVNNVPAIVMQATPFTPIQRRDLIILGAVVHSNFTNINTVNNISAPSNASTNQLHDFIEAVGALNLTGNKYTANGANLSLNKSAGSIFKFGTNFAVDWKKPHEVSQAAGTALTFRYRTQNSTEGSDVTSINPAVYDLNNVLTAVPNNKFTIQTVTMFQTGLTRIQYGQNYYDDLPSAKAAIFTRNFNVESNIKENGVTRAYIIVKNNATSLQNISDADIVEAQKFGGIASGGVALTLANVVTALGYTPENLANKGVANGYASLGADGKVPNSQIPALAISETFPVSSQAEMLALSQAEQGDVAIRSDISKSFILRQSPPSILANWSELLTPTDAVTSVNGKVGVVNLTTDDIPDSTNKRYQTDAQQTNNDATSSIQNQLNSKISGSGTSNYIPKTTSSNILGDSQIYDNGSDVGLFTNTPSAYQHSGSNKAVEIYNPSTSVDAQSHVILSNASIQPLSSIGSLTWALRNSTNSVKMAGVFGAVTDASFTSLSPRTNVFLNVHNGSVSAEAFRVLYNGNFGIGTPSPIAKLDVNGTSNFRDMITLNAQDKAFIIGTSGATNFAQIYYGSSSKSLIFTDSAGGNTFIIRDSDKRVSIPNLSGTGTRTVVADTSGNLSATNTINSQINTGTPTAPTAAAGTNTTQIATTAFVMANARPYKTYVAKISQTGTSNPTSIVLENTTGLTFTLTRTLTGFYEISPGVSMGSNLHIAINKEHADALVTLQHYSDSIIRIITTDLSGNPVDTKLANNSFELRIYP